MKADGTGPLSDAQFAQNRDATAESGLKSRPNRALRPEVLFFEQRIMLGSQVLACPQSTSVELSVAQVLICKSRSRVVRFAGLNAFE